MRTITCDRCGYSQNEGDPHPIKEVNINFNVTSAIPSLSESDYVRVDLCENCRAGLRILLENIIDHINSDIDGWLNKGENTDENSKPNTLL